MSDTAIVVLQNGITENVDRSDVKKLYKITRDGSKAKSVAIGAGVGAGLGIAAAFGILATTDGAYEASHVFAGLIAAGAGAGTVLGLLVHGRGKTLVYEVK